MSEVFRKLDLAEWCEHILVHTGQHYDKLLSGIFFKELKIRQPDYNLEIGSPGKAHYQQQSELGWKIIDLIKNERLDPDLIIFLGDSNSVLASVPLKKEGFKIAHIEAGMRSGDMRMLEEINRRICDQMSDLLFVYHEEYASNLVAENIQRNKIKVVGNTIMEPLRAIADFTYAGKNSHILLDIHRPENFNFKSRIQRVLSFSSKLGKQYGVPVKMLKFKRTLQKIKDYNIKLQDYGIELEELKGYKDYIRFMQDSVFMISDSGTAQEEPALLNVPVLVPRDFTERRLSYVNNNSKKISLDDDCFSDFSDSIEWLRTARENMNVEWIGGWNTSFKIVNGIRDFLK